MTAEEDILARHDSRKSYFAVRDYFSVKFNKIVLVMQHEQNAYACLDRICSYVKKNDPKTFEKNMLWRVSSKEIKNKQFVDTRRYFWNHLQQWTGDVPFYIWTSSEFVRDQHRWSCRRWDKTSRWEHLRVRNVNPGLTRCGLPPANDPRLFIDVGILNDQDLSRLGTRAESIY